MQETWVRSLNQEDPLEKGMVTHYGILAWRISKDRGAWRATGNGVAESDTTEATEHSSPPSTASFRDHTGFQRSTPVTFCCALPASVMLPECSKVPQARGAPVPALFLGCGRCSRGSPLPSPWRKRSRRRNSRPADKP